MNSSIKFLLFSVAVGAGCAQEDERYKVPGLLKMLQDKDPDQRCTAAQVLGSYGPEAKPGVTLLAAALKDESEAVRVCVAYGLADIGPDAAEASAALEDALLKDESAKVRVGAAYALGTIRARSPTVVAVLGKAARTDRDRGVREEAARSWKGVRGGDGKDRTKAKIGN